MIEYSISKKERIIHDPEDFFDEEAQGFIAGLIDKDIEGVQSLNSFFRLTMALHQIPEIKAFAVTSRSEGSNRKTYTISPLIEAPDYDDRIRVLKSVAEIGSNLRKECPGVPFVEICSYEKIQFNGLSFEQGIGKVNEANPLEMLVWPIMNFVEEGPNIEAPKP